MRNEASVSAFSPLHRGRVDNARVQIRTVERCDSLWIIHDKNHTVGNSRERAMNRSRARSLGKVHPLDSLFLCLNIRNLPQISQSCTESCARATCSQDRTSPSTPQINFYLYNHGSQKQCSLDRICFNFFSDALDVAVVLISHAASCFRAIFAQVAF